MALMVIEGESGRWVASLQCLLGGAGGDQFGGGAVHGFDDRRRYIVGWLAGFEVGLERIELVLERHGEILLK